MRSKRSLKSFVYRNLHLPGVVWSVQSSKKIIFHANNIIVKNAKLVVRKGGQAKVRATNRKNVHAGVRGEVATDPLEIQAIMRSFSNGARWTRVFYDPYETDTFVDGQGNAVNEATFVFLTSDGGKSHVYVSTF